MLDEGSCSASCRNGRYATAVGMGHLIITSFIASFTTEPMKLANAGGVRDVVDCHSSETMMQHPKSEPDCGPPSVTRAVLRTTFAVGSMETCGRQEGHRGDGAGIQGQRK